jgi:site-specific DNA-methyltransferase (adenine-specific)
MIEVNTIYNTDCLAGLKKLPDDSVDCCVTSPPYYGLRDYGTAKWEGGSLDCQHSAREEAGFEKWKQATNHGNSKNLAKSVCPKCGAIRIDKQIGLEDTPDMFIDKLVEVFSEVYRILKPLGTLWLNMGDTYNGSSNGRTTNLNAEWCKKTMNKSGLKGGCSRTIKCDNLKDKDLIGIPWMLAFALRKAGWYLRQDIIWHKPNAMPESVKDRFMKAHEYVFLLTKSKHYYFNLGAIIENGKNKRSVWNVAKSQCTEDHFATFPQKLIVDCIKAGCPENGIILDPFMGSGTTAVVARKLNRNYVGFELNPDYIRIANNRINKELGIFK